MLKNKFLFQIIFLFVFLLLALSGCSILPSDAGTPTATDFVLPKVTATQMPVCTPPPCDADEAYFCPDDCPGGCGTVCATHTPAANLPAEPPAPTPTPAPPVRFAVIGSYGVSGDALAAVATLVQGWNPNFIITTGGNNLPAGAAETMDANIGQYFSDFIAPYSGEFGPGAPENRFFPALSAEDWDTDNAQPYLDYFSLPGNERYYDFVQGPVHFFVLNSDPREPDGVERLSQQAKWLEAGLNASDSVWQLVYFHHAPFSSGLEQGSTDWMQWPFLDWGADVVISGNQHFYERLLIDELPYFVVGNSGAPDLFTLGDPIRGSQVRDNKNYGALAVDATEEYLTFVYETSDNQILDAYQIRAPEEENVETSTDERQAALYFPDPNDYTWELVADNLKRPLGVWQAGDGTSDLYVIEQSGVIRLFRNGYREYFPFLDISDRVNDEGNEQGLLGMAFHPNFEYNGVFYVNYTAHGGDTYISSFKVDAETGLADARSEQVLLQFKQPYANHNGGHIEFGPDGFLYIATGDGGSGGDPLGNGQNPDTLLGKILRIAVDQHDDYAIPDDNPYASSGAPEVWATGLRNPWRFTFDPLTGDLYIGDVGQNQWEEINYLPADHPGGANFGWNVWEASHPYEGTPPEGVAMIPPVAEYDHTLGCSVTGGVVYRGRMKAWQGIYLYGDFCSGRIWGLLQNAEGEWQSRELFNTNAQITSFGQAENGEVYLVDRAGGVYKLQKKQ